MQSISPCMPSLRFVLRINFQVHYEHCCLALTIIILGQMARCEQSYTDFVCWTPCGIHIEHIFWDYKHFNHVSQGLTLSLLYSSSCSSWSYWRCKCQWGSRQMVMMCTVFVEGDNMVGWWPVTIHSVIMSGFILGCGCTPTLFKWQCLWCSNNLHLYL